MSITELLDKSRALTGALGESVAAEPSDDVPKGDSVTMQPCYFTLPRFRVVR